MNEIPKPLSEMTEGNELLLRAVINVALRVMELNGVSKKEFVGVEYCFSDRKGFARMEHAAGVYPGRKAILVGKRIFERRLKEPLGLLLVIEDLIHEFLHILHPVSPEEYTEHEKQIEEEIERKAEQYFRKGLFKIAASWVSLKSQENQKVPSSKRQPIIAERKMTKKDVENIIDEFCTCGHLASEHEQPHQKCYEKCNKPGCDCGWYTWAGVWVLKDGTRVS